MGKDQGPLGHEEGGVQKYTGKMSANVKERTVRQLMN